MKIGDKVKVICDLTGKKNFCIPHDEAVLLMSETVTVARLNGTGVCISTLKSRGQWWIPLGAICLVNNQLRFSFMEK